MFGRDYEEIGSLDKGLVLKSSGKIKILWGKTLIDLLDDNGNLNFKAKQLIKKVSSEKEIKGDGFYYYEDLLLAKLGNNVISIGSNQKNIYVSFIEELNASSELKYTALKNIGFIYPNISQYNKYPKNGIIYVEDTNKLYIVTNGKLSEYQIDIPNPYTKQFVISKNANNNSEGALVIEGSGIENSLRFDSMKIYSNGDIKSIIRFNRDLDFYAGNKKILTINLDGLQTLSIKSESADETQGYRIYEDSFGKYILDIDKINVRDGLNDNNKYFDDEFYSECFKIDYFYPSVSEQGVITEIFFNTNIKNKNANEDLDGESGPDVLLNNSLIEIPVRVIKRSGMYPDSYISYHRYSTILVEESGTNVDVGEEVMSVPLERIYRFRFKYVDNKLYFVSNNKNRNNALISVLINSEYEINNSVRDAIIIEDELYTFEEVRISQAFKGRSAYVISTPNDLTIKRIKVDLKNKNPEICLQLNEKVTLTQTNPHKQVELLKIGNIKSYRTYNDYPPDNEDWYNGLYSTLNIFIGAEFRHLKTLNKYYTYPRYSQELVKGIRETMLVEPDYNGIILPKKWIPQAANYIEDLTAFSSILETRDDNLYNGKLFLYKVTGTSSSNDLSVTFQLSPRYNVADPDNIRINVTNVGPFLFYDRDSSTPIKEDYFKQNTIILAQYKGGVNGVGGGKIYVLRNPGIITINNNGVKVLEEPLFYNINFLNSNNIDLTATYVLNTKTINVSADVSSTLSLRLSDIENAITLLQNNISSLSTDVSNLSNTVSGYSGSISNINSRLDVIENDYSTLRYRVALLENANSGS